MKYEKYIISFVPGSSGRFVTQILDRMIRKSTDPILITESNSAHGNDTYTGISIPNPNNRNIYELFDFDPPCGDRPNISRILSSHVFPKFSVIQERFTDLGTILISIDSDDLPEIMYNSYLKNRNIKLSQAQLNQIVAKSRPSTAPFIEECTDWHSANCLVIKYKEIFEEVGDSFKALEKIIRFTGLDINNETLVSYKTYVSNRNTMLVNNELINRK